MRLSYWIYYENPGEKQELKKIMEESFNDFKKNELIQEKFNVDMLTANRIIETYNKFIKK